MRKYAALLLASLCAACASKAPQPEPDPAALKRLLAHLESCAGPCDKGASASGLPVNFDEKVRDADRLMPALEKVSPDKVDPALAAALIAG